MRDRSQLLAIAVGAAHDAAAIIRARARDATGIEWRVKSPADFVSEVDTAAEHAIRQRIARDAPEAVVMGEEISPDEVVSAGLTFIADPLDGTTNFLHGFPAYAVSIGVLVEGELIAGTIVDVPMDETYTAVLGTGSRRDDQPIRVSRIDDPGRALIGTGFPFKNIAGLETYQRQFAAITRATAGIRRPGSAALDLAHVAAGRFDAFWELSLSPWDFAAGMILVREAGGVITDLAGRSPPFTASSIVAGNPGMHAWLLEALARSSPARSETDQT
jgi:myo-inositol-1(or 4)-monophosphatase